MNYDYVNTVINDVIDERDVYGKNVPIKHLIKSDPEVKLLTYDEFADFMGISTKEVSKFGGSRSGFHISKDSMKCIVYNSGRNIKESTFTLAHEYGHLKLSHKGKKLADQKANDKIIEEIEANRFADTMLKKSKNVYAPKHELKIDIKDSKATHGKKFMTMAVHLYFATRLIPWFVLFTTSLGA